jgi:hypothetical protein
MTIDIINPRLKSIKKIPFFFSNIEYYFFFLPYFDQNFFTENNLDYTFICTNVKAEQLIFECIWMLFPEGNC